MPQITKAPEATQHFRVTEIRRMLEGLLDTLKWNPAAADPDKEEFLRMGADLPQAISRILWERTLYLRSHPLEKKYPYDEFHLEIR